MADSIVTESIVKRFGSVTAVDGVSLHVAPGEIYGFLGLNGAGKTTTIRMLLGMIKPTSGEAYLLGRRVSPQARELWSRVGYLVESPYAYPDLTVRDNLEIVRRLRLLDDPGSVDEIMETLGLVRYRDRLSRHLSLGNAQRLGLAKALIHRPELLILDEPANALDPAGIVEIRELLKRLAAEEGVSVFISSHILGEISRFADRIGIIHEGRMVQEVDSGELERLLRRRLLVTTGDNRRALALLEEAGYSGSVVVEEDAISMSGERPVHHPEEVAALLVNGGLPPTMLKVDGEDLETHFLRVIGAGQGGGR